MTHIPEPVAVVIVNWNTGHLLRDCLLSLLSPDNNSTVLRIVVVDNASSDTSIQLAKEAISGRSGISKVTFIESDTNLGFAAANNRGIAYIREHYTPLPHILFLNPDTVVGDWALVHMARLFEQQPHAGIIGPKLLNPDGSLQPSVRQLPTLAILLIFLLKLPRFWPKMGRWRQYLQLDLDYSQEQTVPQVMGAAFLVRDAVLTKLPTWDEGYFVWFEEVDYCARVQAAGWDVWYTPTATITHYGGVSFNQLIGWSRVKPWLHSLRLYAKQHLGTGAVVLISLLYPLAMVLSIPAGFSHRRQKVHNQIKD